jgi:hypothetical protein
LVTTLSSAVVVIAVDPAAAVTSAPGPALSLSQPLKPTLQCDPSQNGLFFEAPHRQSV